MLREPQLQGERPAHERGVKWSLWLWQEWWWRNAAGGRALRDGCTDGTADAAGAVVVDAADADVVRGDGGGRGWAW